MEFIGWREGSTGDLRFGHVGVSAYEARTGVLVFIILEERGLV